MDAFRDHGEIVPDAVEKDLVAAKTELDMLEKAGISLKEITDELVIEGVQSFSDAFDKLLGAVAQRRPADAVLQAG
jgi:transaldolase/glucose-6-phosphate isomerase